MRGSADERTGLRRLSGSLNALRCRIRIEKASGENDAPEARRRNGDVADDAVVLPIIVTRESLRGVRYRRQTTQSLRTCQILPTNAGGISPTVCRQYFAAVNSRKKGVASFGGVPYTSCHNLIP